MKEHLKHGSRIISSTASSESENGSNDEVVNVLEDFASKVEDISDDTKLSDIRNAIEARKQLRNDKCGENHQHSNK